MTNIYSRKKGKPNQVRGSPHTNHEKYMTNDMTNVWKIYDKYITNIWQTHDKYLFTKKMEIPIKWGFHQWASCKIWLSVLLSGLNHAAQHRHCNRMNKNMATEQDRNFNIRCYRRDTTFCAQDIASEDWTATSVYVLQEQAYCSREPICGDTTHTRVLTHSWSAVAVCASFDEILESETLA